ncbi:unnamed protein product [Lymnaea stagnalis]|uniref:Uncharacterized protein n=1 Tax=Lymnaea stagnalis TaxID=6523 RepID=A0AAV2HW29_LYMST
MVRVRSVLTTSGGMLRKVILLLLVTLARTQNGADTASTKPGPACWLETSSGYREQFAMYIKEGTKLLEMTIVLNGHPPDMLDIASKKMYRPYSWIRSTGRQGRSLLMLDETHRYLSLSTLAIGVESMHVNLTDHPPRCLRGKEEVEILKILRESFLRNLEPPEKNDEKSLGLEDHICNIEIVQAGDIAEFPYTCCRKDADGTITCEAMSKDGWIQFLLALIIIIKVVVILCSPLFVPETMYRMKFVAAPYIYHVPGPPLSLKILVTENPEQYGPDNRSKKIRLSKLQNMEYFKTMVATTRWTPDRIYEVKVQDVKLSVKSRRLLNQDNVPVTIIKLIYNNFIRCRLRHLESLKECCSTNILGRFNPGLKIITWFQCMKIFASFVILIMIAIPWIIRIITYYVYEEPLVLSKVKAAGRLGLALGFPTNIVPYLSPVHGLFIIIYVLLIVDSLFFGVVSRSMKRKLKTVFRQCLRDMRERPRVVIVSWMTSIVVKPFRVFGVVGIVFFIPYLIVLLIVTIPICLFYIFPTINLSVRLIFQFFIFICPTSFKEKCEGCFSKLAPLKSGLQIHKVTANETFRKRHHYTGRGLALQLVSIFMCLISFWSITFLLMEICSYFVELFVYTFMGIIINAGVTLQYVSVILLVLLYCKNIFSKVHEVYKEYHKVIHKLLMDIKKDDITEVAKREATDQENTVFRVVGDMATNKANVTDPRVQVKNCQPYWATTGMLLFLDQHDTPYTPEKFFHETIDLNYYQCPGPIYKNVWLAVLQFLQIVLFLMFVFVVVMAFGDAYKVSTTNQLLATVVTGVVPFMFSVFFKDRTEGETLDTSSVQFQTEFHKSINNFSQSWPVYDIVPTDVKEWDGLAGLVVGSEGSTDGNANRNKTSTLGCGSELDEADAERNSLMLNMSSSSEDGDYETVKDETSTKVTVVDMNDDEFALVDIIVDISTPKTRKVSPLIVRGFEKGSVSMLDRTGRVESLKPNMSLYSEERAIDV